MKIGFVAEPYEESNASGMGYVVLELLKNLPLKEGDTLTIYSSKPVSRERIAQPFTNVLISKTLVGKLFWAWRLKDTVDTVLFVAPLLPLVFPKKITAVMICQELGSQKTPVFGIKERILAILRDRILMPFSLSKAAVVIAASQATKKDIHEFYTVPNTKVVVVYDGYQDLSVYKDTAPAVDEAMKPFFFFAGKVKSRKNVHGIVSAFILFKKRTNADAKLVIAGDYGGEYYQNILREIQEHTMEKEIFFVGYAVGARLYSFYKHALALVFPSFNEGFGMPPLEAMSLGLPVITSNLSSMAEVVGSAGLLVNPYDIADISDALERVYSDKTLRNELIAKGYARSKEFSWQKAAGEVMYILRPL